jgi:hypothetical protein
VPEFCPFRFSGSISVPEPILTIRNPDKGVRNTESSVSERDSTVSKRDSTVSKRDSTVSKRDSTVSKRDSTVSKRDSYIEREYKETYEDIMGRAIEPPLNWLFFFLKQILEVISSNLAGASTHRCPVLLHVSPVTRF